MTEQAALTARILTDFPQASRLWAKDAAVYGAPQSFAWIDCWRGHVNPDCFVAGLFANDRPVLLLPLEVVTSKGVKIARYPGGSHANCNFPWIDPETAGLLDRDALDRMVAAIRKARPEIDALSLTRQLPTLSDMDSPLLQLGRSLNPNPVLAASLSGGFDAILERSNRRRRLKKHRQHGRRYEEIGGWKIASPETHAESDGLLDLFFEMKAHRFRQMGISDPFADAGVQAFFKALFAKAVCQADATNELRFLEAGGVVRSIIGKTISKTGPTVDFGAIADDDLITASPGEFLFFEDIKRSCDIGHPVYSLGIGDEPYKRDWCDIEFAIYDTVLPLSAKGRMYAFAQTLTAGLAVIVKRNPRLWQFAKTVRSKFLR
ncbi:GNAT family N-acetyltransferase [Ochrobactrum sp. CM-21-5]|nr:GNAT family N-acetyltransferase [Ochrobactrum sp. CM-21-5]MBC2884909.1 GNAT family N-acetyltransferase [Ochrobactrum sp. CM-21-5]